MVAFDLDEKLLLNRTCLSIPGHEIIAAIVGKRCRELSEKLLLLRTANSNEPITDSIRRLNMRIERA